MKTKIKIPNSFSPLKAKSLKLKAIDGFTLIELMVSIAIFVVITGIIMVDQRRFGGNILISNLAYDVALGVRQAQVYGISVKAVNNQFNTGYGVHFGPSGYFILFADIDGDGRYTSAGNQTSCAGSAECVSFFKIEGGNSIVKFCADTDCAGLNGDGTPTNNNIDGMDIIFHRPDPEPTVHAVKNNALIMLNGVVRSYGNAVITVSSDQGLTKTVTVSQSGQISIK